MPMKSSYKDELISEIKSLAQSQGLNTVFTTFLEITATSIAAQMDPQNAEEREQRYQAIASKMTPETLSSYARMFALLALATKAQAEDPCDILGDVYHQLGLNNEWNGQFFTPDHICRLMAQLTDIDVPADKERPITINEPTCGSGTMVTFRFHCTQCGKCCINREDILMSPQDVFKAAQALQMTPHDFVQLYCECYLGSTSRMPIVRLQPRGSIKRCPLLKDRKCMIHDAKPAVCAMFPLGRAIRIDKEDAEKDELPPMKVEYIINPIDCGDFSETHTVKDWLESFGIPLEDEYFLKWQKTISMLSPRIQKLEKELDDNLMDKIISVMYIKLYLDYDLGIDFYPQFVKNADGCVEMLKMLLAMPNEEAV